MARLFNKAPNFCLSCLTNDTLSATCVDQCLCLCKLWAFVAAFPQLTHCVCVSLQFLCVTTPWPSSGSAWPWCLVWSPFWPSSSAGNGKATLYHTTHLCCVWNTFLHYSYNHASLCSFFRVHCISLSCCHLKMWERILFKPVFEKYH